MKTIHIRVQDRTVVLLFALLLGLSGGVAVGAVGGTTTRWVNNALVFDGTSGNDAFAFDVDGLRARIGTGANAYITSDGTDLSTPTRFTGAMGATTAVVSYNGTLTVNTSTVGSGADTTEDNLQTFAMVAGTISVNGRGVRYTASGDGVSTADVTTVRCYFGATVCATKVLTASQANTWRMQFEVLRTGAATQTCSGDISNGGTAGSVQQTNATPAETLANSITVKCTGQRATSSVANSVRQLTGVLETID